MAGDPDKASLWADADVWVADTLTTPNPATYDQPFGAGWGLAGLLDGDDGFEEGRDEDKSDFFAWGGILVRTSRKNFKMTKKFSALENNAVVRRLVYPGSTRSQIVVPRHLPLKVGLEVREDTKVHRLITRRYAVVDEIGAIKDGESDLTKYEITLAIYPDAGKVLFDEQDSDTVESVQVTPATASVAVGGTKPLALTALLADESEQDVTAVSTWSSSDTSKATVSPGGVVTGVASGSATITGAYDGETADCAVTVTGA